MVSGIDKNNIKFSLINPSQVTRVCDVINRAFAADKFFKKPEYFDRVAVADVEQIASQGEHGPATFIVGTDVVTDTVLAAIHVEWQLRVQVDESALSACSPQSIVDGSTFLSINQASRAVKLSLNGHFSQVSVDPTLTNMGIGRMLVKALEDYTVSYAKRLGAVLEHQLNGIRPVRVEASTDMIVLDVRPELRPWYERQGYRVLSEGNAFTYSFICREDYPPITTSHLHKQLL